MNEKFEKWFAKYATDGSDKILHENIKVNQSLRDCWDAAEAAHKAEVSELVEALYKITKGWEISKSFEMPTSAGHRDAIRIAHQALAPYKQVPCKECGGSGRLRKVKIVDGVINLIEDVNCSHCTDGHVREKEGV